jgi:2',3'-cyclic-nucleotide 2'-phosphodiesterase (5'-nucleotidase family)
MGKAGVDVTTIGNHEFDYDIDGLADMFEVASKAKKDQDMPTVVGTNIDWEKSLENKEEAKKVNNLKKAFNKYGVEDYTVIEKNGIRIALFGHMGDDSISTLSGNANLVFEDRVNRAKEIIAEIKQNKDADLIVCLSHSGINPDDWEESEDVKLAKEVEGIDLIVSAHTHDLLEKVEMVGDTAIAAVGSFTQNIGHIVFEKNGDNWKVKSYKVTALDDSVKADKEISNLVKSSKTIVNRKLSGNYAYISEPIEVLVMEGILQKGNPTEEWEALQSLCLMTTDDVFIPGSVQSIGDYFY